MKETSDAALVLNQRPNDSWRGRSLSKVLAQPLAKVEEAGLRFTGDSGKKACPIKKGCVSTYLGEMEHK